MVGAITLKSVFLRAWDRIFSVHGFSRWKSGERVHKAKAAPLLASCVTIEGKHEA